MRRATLLLCICAHLLPDTAWAVTFQSSGLYQSFDQMATWAAGMQTANPDLVNVIQYGSTTGGRPLLALDITVNPQVHQSSKPEFLFTAGIHAREVVTSDAVVSLANTLVNGYRQGDPLYRNILSTRNVWIIPDQNPDGRIAVEGGRSDQRKNMHWYLGQNSDDSTCGVDINRNYPHRWDWISSTWTGGSDVPIDETYRGPSVLSEPESGSLWALLNNHTYFSHLLAGIDFHSGAETILTPWASTTEFAANPLPTTDRQKYDFLAGRLQQLTGFSTARLGYDSWGSLTDSVYEQFHSYFLAEEIYGQSFGDYFATFNPIDRPTYDTAVSNAMQSAMFLLSNEAFAVPEPSLFALLATSGLVWLAIRAKERGVAAQRITTACLTQKLIPCAGPVKSNILLDGEHDPAGYLAAEQIGDKPLSVHSRMVSSQQVVGRRVIRISSVLVEGISLFMRRWKCVAITSMLRRALTSSALWTVIVASASAATYNPSQIQTVYGINSISGIPASNLGANQTIAIVDPYHYETALRDLNYFSSQMGLPTFGPGGPTFTQYSAPDADPTGGWQTEAALDLQWAHAIAPRANLVLVWARA